ncbi:hypothetical protein FQA39_LY19253 [Lamprigera yunnana]|nr:hypothetical protein FQA39_LY19253 [Lamprigera yunnana]
MEHYGRGEGNQNGQLAVMELQPLINTPEQVGTETDWDSKKDETLWAVGGNNYGQLGDVPTVNKLTPTQIGTDY